MRPNFDVFFLARRRADVLVRSAPTKAIPMWIQLVGALNMMEQRNSWNDIAGFIWHFKNMYRSSRFRNVLEQFGTRDVKAFYDEIRGVRNANLAAIARVTPAMVDNLTEVAMIYGAFKTSQHEIDRLFTNKPVLAKAFLTTIPSVPRKAQLFKASMRGGARSM